MAGAWLPSGPPGAGGNNASTAQVGTPFGDRDWTNGSDGKPTPNYRQNTLGPWQRPDRLCVAPWPARGAGNGNQNYFLRPSSLRAEATWAFAAPQTRPTAFHVRQTKLIDHPCDAMVIETNGNMVQNYGSHKPSEWLLLADSGPTGAMVANAPATSYIQWFPFLMNKLEAVAIPNFRNSNCVEMHVLVHLPLLTSSPVAGHVYPPGMAVAGVVRQNYHLRACWYAVLEEAINPTQPVGGANGNLTFANLAVGNPGAAAYVINPARSIAFPLIGYRNSKYGFERAAQQACEALREWFTPTPGSESITTAADAALPIATLRANRRTAYDDVFLTLPNGYGNYNPRVTPGTEVLNVYKDEMGGQEYAWHQAFFNIFRCPTCGTDELS